MKHYRKLIVPGLIVVFAALAGCGKQTVAPAPQDAPAIATDGQPKNVNATILGAVKDNDWYMVVSAPGNAKPLVIWSESKEACDRDVGEFSLKAVDAASKVEPPKAWCLLGKEIRSKLGV